MTRTTETFAFVFFFFFKREMYAPASLQLNLTTKGYLQIVTLLFRLPYVCLMIKFGSIRQRCVVPTQHVVYI